MKVYTRRGDAGTSSLIGANNILKAELIFEALGDLDELNSHLGVIRAMGGLTFNPSLLDLQILIFQIGAEVASEPGHVHAQVAPMAGVVEGLEMAIDAMTSELPQLKNFILPGGSAEAARLHLARTVCRRAERHLVGLSKSKEVRPILIAFINRLSDWLFTAARLANVSSGQPETEWKPV